MQKPPAEAEGTTSSDNHSQGKATSMDTHNDTRKLTDHSKYSKAALVRLIGAAEHLIDVLERRATRVPRTISHTEGSTVFVGATQPGRPDELVTVNFSDEVYALVSVDDYVARHKWFGIDPGRQPAYLLAKGAEPTDEGDPRTYWPVTRHHDGHLSVFHPERPITPADRARRADRVRTEWWAHTSWAQILEPFGWKVEDCNGERTCECTGLRRKWVQPAGRPGQGHELTEHAPDCREFGDHNPALFLWWQDHCLDSIMKIGGSGYEGRNITAFDLYATLHFGGDFVAARRDIEVSRQTSWPNYSDPDTDGEA